MSGLPMTSRRRALARELLPSAKEPMPTKDRSGMEPCTKLPLTPALSNHDLTNSTTAETSTMWVKSGLLTPSDSNQNIPGIMRSPSQDRRQNEKEEREMFSMLEKPRVRYDVEVVTKLIVYSGEWGRCVVQNLELTWTRYCMARRRRESHFVSVDWFGRGQSFSIGNVSSMLVMGKLSRSWVFFT